MDPVLRSHALYLYTPAGLDSVSASRSAASALPITRATMVTGNSRCSVARDGEVGASVAALEGGRLTWRCHAMVVDKGSAFGHPGRMRYHVTAASAVAVVVVTRIRRR